MATKTLLQVALDEYGFKETPGAGTNPEIDKYHESVGKPDWDEDVAWCSSFLNWCANEAGLERSKSAAARSWTKVGIKLASIADCIPGDIIVLHNGDPSNWRGHVGIYINKLPSRQCVYVLGGNQRNQVNIQEYPVQKIREHGIRRLRKLTDLDGKHDIT